jgi:hypothetical protein
VLGPRISCAIRALCESAAACGEKTTSISHRFDEAPRSLAWRSSASSVAGPTNGIASASASESNLSSSAR